jgi:hypothetical protein
MKAELGRPRRAGCVGAALLAALCGVGALAAHVFAQEEALFTVAENVSAFAIAPDDTIAYAVPHLKRFDKILIERDEVWLSSAKGKEHRILDPDKFMPTPPPTTYVIQSLAWSPDGQKLSMAMVTKAYPWSPKVKGKKKGQLDDDDLDNTYDDNAPTPASSSGNVMALIDQGGGEIKVANSKTRFIEGALSGTWLKDGKTFVYTNGSSQLERVTPDDGKSAAMFAGKRFEAIVWDSPRDRAFAIGEGMVGGHMALWQLDLAHEAPTEIARVDDYKGSLTVSPLGDAIGFYRDGDTIEILMLSNPAKPIIQKTGPGRFEFDRDDRRILLKRGPVDKSNDLVWVRLDDGNYTPILHDLVYKDFHIAPDGNSLGVIEVGRDLLKIYPLE